MDVLKIIQKPRENCHVILGEYFGEFKCLICTLRKITNQKKEEREGRGRNKRKEDRRKAGGREKIK